MTWYRFYLWNADGKVRSVDEIRAPDDEAAVRIAAALDHPHGVEVFRKTHRVALVPGRGATPPIADASSL